MPVDDAIGGDRIALHGQGDTTTTGDTRKPVLSSASL